MRIDQLTGLRVVLAPGRAERPDAFAPGRAESSPDAAVKLPVLRGPRGPHAARGLGRPPGRGRGGHAGLAAALGARTSIRCSAAAGGRLGATGASRG